MSSEIKYFKIHPAIGVTRIANNEDYFEFFEAFQTNFSPASDFMSPGGAGDPQQGKMRLKRQAVKFTVFAYGEDDNLLGKLAEVMPGAETEWTAKLGNRKLYNYSEKKGGVQIDQITSEGTVSGNSSIDLQGTDPFDSSNSVYMGTMKGDGTYIPPKGGVIRKTPQSKIDRYPANASGNLECSDTSCDGSISAQISADGVILDIPVISAWVIATPSQHALTLTPVTAQEMQDNFGSFDPFNNNHNTNWIKSTQNLLNISGKMSLLALPPYFEPSM